MMKRFFLLTMLLLAAMAGMDARTYTLSNENVSVEIGEDGSLISLVNVHTGHNYASGGYLWRLYYDAPYEKEIQVVGGEQTPEVSAEGDVITIVYDRLNVRGETVAMGVKLRVILEADKVRFASEVSNNEPHTVIRELQYPLVRGTQLPSDHKLYTSEAGGQLFSNPVKVIGKLASSPYKKPEQFFRQKDVKYGAKVFMNCFGLFGEKQGLYFGSHDDSFQDTWHGLRVYKDDKGKFTSLEFGFFKYPHCFCSETWSCDANVVAPYNGTWHVASRIYRDWVDTWWDHRATPEWVRGMKSWQRVIFKHQYGEYFFKYPDMNGKVDEAGQSVGCNTLFLFGWWAEGMDHGNPDYSPDETQGGDAALKAEIAKYQSRGNNLILYYNGKLIDRESRYYRSGMGPKVCRHDNTGSEILERYKFTGQGTWLGEYDQRTFAVATMMDPEWNNVLFGLQDRAYELGARSVFFDQLGYIEKESTNWDNSREYPVPDVYGIRKRAQCLKLLRDRYAEKDPDFALGAEGTVDALCQYCDYTHGYPANDGPERWINFFRYTFPEIVFTERGQRDDVDAERHVNNSVLDGQRNDIEIFRCRDIISAAPGYQKYLAQANAIKDRYSDCLLKGSYNDVFGFTSSNPAVDARSFVNGRRMTVVVANQNTGDAKTLKTTIKVPGYHFVESMTTGTASVNGKSGKVTLGQFDLAALLYEKDAPKGTDVRIGTFNLWRSDLGKDDYAWANRKEKLAQAVVENDFDIFAAEEVDTAMFRVLPGLVADKGGKYSWFTFSPYAADGSGSMKAQAVVYKPERFEMLESHHFWFSGTPDEMSSDWDEKKFKRGACCFTFMDKLSKRKIFVMVSHMPLGREANYHAAEIILERAKMYNPENLPAFFIGDLNTREERNSSVLLRTYWTDTYLTDCPKTGSKGTFNSYGRNVDMDAAPRIDFIYFKGESIYPMQYVVNLKKYDGIYPSDHCPVYADFKY